jgi:hypothetical protein
MEKNIPKEKKKRGSTAHLRWSPVSYLSAVAAAAKYDNDGKDNDPGAVIIEDVAEAVVIHMFPPKCRFGDFHRSLTFYAKGIYRLLSAALFIAVKGEYGVSVLHFKTGGKALSVL